MSIQEQIQEQIKDAMRAKDAPRLSALRMIRAALIEEAKSGAGAVDDERTIAAIARVRKQRLDSAQAYKDAARADLAEAELFDVGVCDTFLPKRADPETLTRWVAEALQTSGARSTKELGKVMGALMKAHKGEFDAGEARKRIEQDLAKLES